tara:strand:+ start:150 stop:566 length:417 start_codon:yes stop_codon:yes gene_type:complete
MSNNLYKNFLVRDVMITMGNFPVVKKDTILKEAIETMGLSNLGIISVVDNNDTLLGVITDGDLRRKLLKVQKPLSFFLIDDVIDHCIKEPLTILLEVKLMDALKIMEDNEIWDLPVVNENKKLIGMLHLHQVVKKLFF